MRIHYLSDLHLEFYDLTKIPRLVNQIVPQSPICVLAGDIGYLHKSTYAAFLRGIYPKFDHIFLIHGNHEYYEEGKTEQHIHIKNGEIIASIDPENQKIHFLDNSHYDLPNTNIRFIGSVLWSKITQPEYVSNDFEMITGISVESYNVKHERCRAYIKSALQEAIAENKAVVMITHYLPSYTLNHPKYAKYYRYHQCFSSHSDDLICDPVKLWIFGHTHTPIQTYIHDIPCVANPIGYKGEQINPMWNAFIDIEDFWI